MPTTPLDVLSQDIRATEHRRAIHMWQRSTHRNPPSNRAKQAPERDTHLFSAEDGATTERRRRFQSQPVGFFREVALEGLTRGQGRSRLVHPLTEKSKSVRICGGGSNLALGEGNCGCSQVPCTSCQFNIGAFPPLALPCCLESAEDLLEWRSANYRTVCEKRAMEGGYCHSISRSGKYTVHGLTREAPCWRTEGTEGKEGKEGRNGLDLGAHLPHSSVVRLGSPNRPP